MDESEKRKVVEEIAELVDLIKKKDETSKNIAKLAKGIYIYESSFLEDTQVFGNMIQGCITTKNENKGRPKFTEADRLFSNSSVTSKAAISDLIDPVKANNENNIKVEENLTSKKSHKSMESIICKLPLKEISVGRFSTKCLFTQSDSKVSYHGSLNTEMPSAASGSRPTADIDAIFEINKNSVKPKKSKKGRQKGLHSDSRMPATQIDVAVKTIKNSVKPKKSNHGVGGSMESSASKLSKNESIDKMSSGYSTKGRQKGLHSDSRMSEHYSPDSKMPSAALGGRPATQVAVVVPKKSNQSVGGSMESSSSKLSKKESVYKMSSGRSSTKERQTGLHSDSRMSDNYSLDSKTPSAALGCRPATQIDVAVETIKNKVKPKKSNQSVGGSMESSSSKLSKNESVDKMSSGRSSTKRRQKRLHSDSSMP